MLIKVEQDKNLTISNYLHDCCNTMENFSKCPIIKELKSNKYVYSRTYFSNIPKKIIVSKKEQINIDMFKLAKQLNDICINCNYNAISK
jgi:hypothetical protein